VSPQPQPQVQAPPEQKPKETNNGDDHLGNIRTIARGFAGGGSSKSAQRRHLRNINSVNILPPRMLPPITFLNEDFSIHDPD